MATKTNTEIQHGGRSYEYFRITRTVGHEIKDGKLVAVKKQFTAKSKRAAEKKYEEWKQARDRAKHENAVASGKTLRELADFYDREVLAVNSRYAASTRKRYSDAYNHQFKKCDMTGILSKPIESIVPADFQRSYNKLDVPMSTLQTINKFFAGFFKWSVLNQYSPDLLSAVVLPEKKTNKRKEGIVVWTDEELEKIFSCVGTHRLRFLIYLAAYSGMRISEMLGLKYEDISDVIRVRHQYYRGELKEPKYSSMREIPLHPSLPDELALHRMQQENELNRKSDFVFTSSTGNFLDDHDVRKSLVRFYKKNGIPMKSPHTYRATFCTNLCRSGVPLQVASKLMGHKSVEVTARFYAFVDAEEKRRAVNNLPDFADVKKL